MRTRCWRPVTGFPVVLCLTAALTAPDAQAGADGWPGFRGARGDGIAPDAHALDRPGGIGLHVAWKKPLGSGYSAVAAGGGLVVTTFSDGTSDHVAAFAEADGEELWRYRLADTYKGHDGSHDGPISTPLIAEGKAFAIGPRGEFVALSLSSGEPVWATHLVSDHRAKKPHYGFTSSPMFIGGVVVVQIGAEDQAVAAFDPDTGKKLWASGSDTVGYQSAIPYSIAGREQVLASCNKKLLGIDPQAGSVLWEYEHGGMGPRGAWSLMAVPAGAQRLFLAHKDDQSTVVEFTPGDGGPQFKTTWEDRAIRNSYNVPVYHGGHVYAFSSRFLICVDAATGKVRWRSRQPGDGFLTVAGDHLVIATKSGGLHIAKASPEGYQEVAAVPDLFDDLSWCTPAFVGDRIYLRSLSEIARVDIGAPAAIASAAPDLDPVLAGTTFGRFMSDVRSASDKKAVINRFVDGKRFPLVEGDWVHFLYRGPGTDLAVAGDIIGARQERPMHRVPGTDLYYCSLRAEPDARSNYLFIRDYEEILDPLNPRTTSTSLLTTDMEMNFGGGEMEMSWFGMPQWDAPGFLDEPPAHRSGRLESRELESKILKDRPPPGAREGQEPPELAPVTHTVDVYLPSGYDQGTQRYPVAYVFGGGGAKERGQLPRALDNLIGSRVRPLIAVFVNREAPFFGGNPMMFPQMFSEELVPYIDGHYRTLAEPEARACIGSGSAGNTALMCAFNSGKVRKVALQSAFLMESMQGMLESMIGSADKNPMQIYMDWGKYDMRNPHENWDIGDANRKFADKLRGMGYTIAGGEAHDGCGWSSWRNRTDDIFEALFPMGSTEPVKSMK